MTELETVIKEFLVESYENLDQLDQDLVVLEKNPENRERLASVFRTIHTIKGTCGFFGFSRLEKVAHVGENLLSKLRDGEMRLDPERTTALLALVDAVREMLAQIESTGHDGDKDHAPLIEMLTRLLQPKSEATADQGTGTDSTAANAGSQKGEVTEPVVTPEQPPVGEKPPRTRRRRSKTTRPSETQAVAALDNPPAPPESAHSATPEPQDSGIPATGKKPDPAGPEDSRLSTTVSESTIRVDVGLLDKLMTLVGELVLARNQILQFTATQKDATFLSTSQRLNLITTELQEGVMKTRMQPMGNIWDKFPRIVRDLALQCGKQVRIDMEGKETELDKTIIEAIKDPLTHVVRNAVDHGIEAPEVRKTRGKAAEGCLFLRAFHEGGQVNIEISDDGAGIAPDRIKAKALERGLISREQAARMSDRECIHLIFLPGFSTAEKVSNISGRGVGMDVVKTNIERIGGTVDIQSEPRKGTTLKIKIPLTLAIIPALIVTSGGDRYAIPQVSLLELVRLEGEQARKGIEMIHGAPVYRLRGHLLPLVHLDRELRSERPRSEQDVINIVVLQADDRQFGLVVEGINDTEEIVVKPLGTHLKGIPLFAGATIMGDGRVALILDVLGIAQQAGVVSEVRDRNLTELAMHAEERRDSKQSLLLMGLGKDRRLAVPLASVARLEEIPAALVERADSQEVVQYRGEILPLLRLTDLLGGSGSFDGSAPDPLQVVVIAEQGRSVGLVVDRILDIVEASVTMKDTMRCAATQGSLVIQHKVTDLLDIRSALRVADPSFFEQPVPGSCA
ncbi:MAG TPA: chemotaxis protein CheA [Gemmataceae bacterium]|nr:chemotaxis protein CheA [Gemmataceae bacterium]